MGGKARIRRSAVDARERILDAAEAQLIEGGPDSLRLARLASDLEISHPTILHHFGNRDGLVKAVLDRTSLRVQTEVFGALQAGVDRDRAVSLLERLFGVLANPARARMMVWLFLTRPSEAELASYGSRLREIADRIHDVRRARTGGKPEAEDTLFATMLVGMAMFGNAVAGRALRTSAGLGGDKGAEKRFIAWLARLLHEHLERRSV